MKNYDINKLKKVYDEILKIDSELEKEKRLKKLLEDLNKIQCNHIDKCVCPYSKFIMEYENKVQVLCYELVKLINCNKNEFLRLEECPYTEFQKKINFNLKK